MTKGRFSTFALTNSTPSAAGVRKGFSKEGAIGVGTGEQGIIDLRTALSGNLFLPGRQTLSQQKIAERVVNTMCQKFFSPPEVTLENK